MKTSKIKPIPFILAALISLSALASCSNAEEQTNAQLNQTQKPANSEANAPATENDSAQNDAAAIYQIQIDYYEKLIADLESRLLNEKEENFIEISEYKQMIKELEKSISALSDKIANSTQDQITPPENSAFQNKPADPSGNEDLNSSQPPLSDIKQEETDPPTSNPPLIDTTDKKTFSYSIKNGSVTITAYNGSETDVTIPSTIEGLPVTSIGEGAFKESKIEKISLPQSITKIDWFAFSGCKKLFEINLPSTVQSIGYGAFENCSSFLVIKCEKGSYAEAFAASWGILSVAK